MSDTVRELQGHLLLASPGLADPNFYRTVVLLLRHNDEGAFGLVLNRPSRRRVKELLEPLAGKPLKTDQVIYVGGPVAGPLLALHGREEFCELRVQDGLYAATSREHLLELASASAEPIRYFSGYAGWGADQLERELSVGAWITTPASLENVFRRDADESLWKDIAKQIVDSVLGPAVRIKHVPPDVSQN